MYFLCAFVFTVDREAGGPTGGSRVAQLISGGSS